MLEEHWDSDGGDAAEAVMKNANKIAHAYPDIDTKNRVDTTMLKSKQKMRKAH